MMFTAVLLALVSVSIAQDIVLRDGRLFLNGQEFFIKGIDYNPTPLGISSMASTGFGGGGFCSAKEDPVGDFKSACYDSDYIDGGADESTERQPPPGNSWFQAVWQRDFPEILTLGFNTIRLYGANPTTYAASIEYGMTGPGKDHTQFMAYAASNNLKVIFPLFADYSGFLNDNFATYTRYLRWQIDEVGNYSSLIMWQLGNELAYTGDINHPGLYNDPVGMAKYNTYADFARRYTYSKWGRFIPITTAILDLPITYDSLTVQYHVDLLSLNIFRGYTFTDLFTGNSQYKGFNYSICATGKPILISEFGMYPYVTGAVNRIWQTVSQSVDFGVVGATYFEFIDEPVYNKSWGVFAVSVRSDGPGETSTTQDVFLTDVITPKQQYYDLLNGTYQGLPYNIPQDFFSILRRPAYTLSTSTDRCTAQGFLTCPGNTGPFPFCSGNGACNRVTGACDCGSGWTGSDCATPACPNNCNGNGQCSTLVSPPQCVCSGDYYGSDCSTTVASAVSANSCPGSCSNGNGVCSFSYTCNCLSGWTGADCSVVTVNGVFVSSTSVTTGATTSATTGDTTTGTSTGSTTGSNPTTGASSTATGTASTSTVTAATSAASTASATTGTTNSAVKYVPGLALAITMFATYFML